MLKPKPFIIALTDGRPGHETQSKGLITLLNAENQYEVQWLKIKKVSKLTKLLLKTFLPVLSPKWALGFYLDSAQLQLLQSECARLVSAGGETLLPNALLKKYFHQQGYATKNVIATSLRGMSPDYFDAVFTIDETRKNQKPFIYYPIAPNKQLTFELSHKVQQAKCDLGLTGQTVVTVLIGADTKTSQIGTVPEWITWIQHLNWVHPDWKILMTTSRRTPKDFEQALQNAFAENPQLILTLVNHGQQCDIADYIYAADFVVCSPESTSMISEALVSEKKVLIPIFASSAMDAELQAYLAHFEQLQWLKMVLVSNEKDDLVELAGKIYPKNHIHILGQLFE